MDKQFVDIEIKQEIKDEPIFEEVESTFYEVKEECESEAELEEIKVEGDSEPKYEVVDEEVDEGLREYHILDDTVLTILNNSDTNLMEPQIVLIPQLEHQKTQNSIMKRHKTKSMKSKKMVQCLVCKNKFYSRHTLSLHEKTHDMSNIFQCDKCAEGFASLGLLMEHQKKMKHFKVTDSFQDKVRALNKRIYKCKACNLVFYSETTFRFHVKIHAGLLKYSCDVCDEMFNTMSELSHHREALKHGLKCQQCGTISATVQEMEQHSKMHSKWKFFKCSDCNFSTVVHKHLRQHRVNGCPGPKKATAYTPSSNVMCSTCGLTFQNKEIYGKHLPACLSEIKPEDPVVIDGDTVIFEEIKMEDG